MNLIDRQADALPEEKVFVAFRRALSDVGIPYALDPDAPDSIVVDEGTEEQTESDEFMEAFAHRLKLAVIDAAAREAGLEPLGVDDDGNTRWDVEAVLAAVDAYAR